LKRNLSAQIAQFLSTTVINTWLDIKTLTTKVDGRLSAYMLARDLLRQLQKDHGEIVS